MRLPACLPACLSACLPACLPACLQGGYSCLPLWKENESPCIRASVRVCVSSSCSACVSGLGQYVTTCM
jgi:hypothetical protein